jgi:hypothetical protein
LVSAPPSCMPLPSGKNWCGASFAGSSTVSMGTGCHPKLPPMKVLW